MAQGAPAGVITHGIGIGARQPLSAASGREPNGTLNAENTGHHARETSHASAKHAKQALDWYESSDENVPPEHKVQVPQFDPLSQTLKAVTTVTTMRSFWEQQTRFTAKASLKENVPPKAERREKSGGGNSSTLSHHGLSMRDLQQDIARMRKQLEGTSELLQQLTHSQLGLDAEAVAMPNSPSSNSEFDEFTNAGRDDDEDDEEMIFLRSYRENSTALWKVQRQTVRALLAHLDRVASEHSAAKELANCIDRETTCPSPAAGRAPSPSSPLRRPQDLNAEKKSVVRLQQTTLLRHLSRGPDMHTPKMLDEPAMEPDISARLSS